MNIKPIPPPPSKPKRITKQLEIIDKLIEGKFNTLEENPHSVNVHNIVTRELKDLLEIRNLLKGR